MTDGTDGGRQLRARYAFGGAAGELLRTVPLAPDEDVLFHGAMRLRGRGVLRRPAVLRLTQPHLVVLAHFAFRPDLVWVLPRSAMGGMETVSGRIRIIWMDERAVRQVLQLSRWTGRVAPDRPVLDVQEAAELLDAWLAGRGRGTRFGEPQP